MVPRNSIIIVIVMMMIIIIIVSIIIIILRLLLYVPGINLLFSFLLFLPSGKVFHVDHS